MLIITHVWTCDYCGETVVRPQQKLHVLDMPVNYIHLPTGWSIVNGNMVCPRHLIRVNSLVEAGEDADV